MGLSRSFVLLAFAGSGCGSLSYWGDRIPETPPVDPSLETDTDIVTGPIAIGNEGDNLLLANVEPSFGSTLGGQEVRLNGSFAPTTTVSFGGQDVVPSSQSPSLIIVQTPPAVAAGPVDVVVQSGDSSDRLDEGYIYFQDATDQTGTIGTLERFKLVGDYWLDPEPFGGASFAFVDGASDWEVYRDYADALERCRYHNQDPEGYGWLFQLPDFASLIDIGADSVSVQSGSHTITMEAQSDWGLGWYGGTLDDGGVDPTELTALETFDLLATPSNATWPGLGLSQAFTLPAEFAVTAPVVAQELPPSIIERHTLRWTGSGGDYMVLLLLRQVDQNDTWVDDGFVTCAFADDGQFTLPEVWPTWNANRLIHLMLGRVIADDQALPHSNATSRVAGISWIYGGAITQ